MKKYAICTLSLLLLLCFVGCSANSGAPRNNYTEYVLDFITCNNFFGEPPSEVDDEYMLQSPVIQGHCRSAKTNSTGELVLVLSDEDIQFWKKQIDEIVEEYSRSVPVDGYAIVVNEECSQIVSSTTFELYSAAIMDMYILTPVCGVMQMLNGNVPENWYVDIIIKDVETGTIVKKGRISSSSEFGISEEDWERALGGTAA